MTKKELLIFIEKWNEKDSKERAGFAQLSTPYKKGGWIIIKDACGTLASGETYVELYKNLVNALIFM